MITTGRGDDVGVLFTVDSLCIYYLQPKLLLLLFLLPFRSAVSARKLQEKGGGEVGVGLLRESSSEYDTFLLDVIVEANAPPACYTILRQADKVRACLCVCVWGGAVCLAVHIDYFLFSSSLLSPPHLHRPSSFSSSTSPIVPPSGHQGLLQQPGRDGA